MPGKASPPYDGGSCPSTRMTCERGCCGIKGIVDVDIFLELRTVKRAFDVLTSSAQGARALAARGSQWASHVEPVGSRGRTGPPEGEGARVWLEVFAATTGIHVDRCKLARVELQSTLSGA